LLEAPPFARQRANRPRGHPQAREKWREIVREKDRSTQRKHPQLEEKEDTVRSVTMINGAMSSTLMGSLFICPWVVIVLEDVIATLFGYLSII
jgi:hypothetical protein